MSPVILEVPQCHIHRPGEKGVLPLRRHRDLPLIVHGHVGDIGGNYRFGEPERGEIQFGVTFDRFDRDRFPARGGKSHAAVRPGSPHDVRRSHDDLRSQRAAAALVPSVDKYPAVHLNRSGPLECDRHVKGRLR